MSEQSQNEEKFAVTVLCRKYTEFQANVKVNVSLILKRILNNGGYSS